MNFNIRPMTEKDLEVTFEWRNDELVLASALTPNEISKNEHVAMFNYNNSIKLVFEFNDVPVGYIQISRESDQCSGEWSFHMAKEWRGHGLSEIMLRLALYYVKKEEQYIMIHAVVRKENKASNRLHEKLGFRQTHVRDEFYEYELSL